jgi:hypothetical protein
MLSLQADALSPGGDGAGLLLHPDRLHARAPEAHAAAHRDRGRRPSRADGDRGFEPTGLSEYSLYCGVHVCVSLPLFYLIDYYVGHCGNAFVLLKKIQVTNLYCTCVVPVFVI